jgi:hypothetical protein
MKTLKPSLSTLAKISLVLILLGFFGKKAKSETLPAHHAIISTAESVPVAP